MSWVLAAALAASTVPEYEPAPAEVRVRWGWDAGITAVAASGAVALEYGVSPRLSSGDPQFEPRLNALDELALGHFRPGAVIASDVGLVTSIALPFVVHGAEAGRYVRRDSRPRGRRFARRFGADSLLLAETIAIDLVATNLIKLAVRRHRPLSHLEPEDVPSHARDELEEEHDDPDRRRSFPSGHASLSFASAVAGSLLLSLKLRNRKRGLQALMWTGSLLLATTTATLRVVAGKHYPIDIIAGAALGSGIGVAVPLLHRARTSTKRTKTPR